MDKGPSIGLPSAVGTLVIMLVMCVMNGIVVIFCLSLVRLHIKLLKWDFTTYEYILYTRGRKERLRKLKRDEISREEFDYEERMAFKRRGVTK